MVGFVLEPGRRSCIAFTSLCGQAHVDYVRVSGMVSLVTRLPSSICDF